MKAALAAVIVATLLSPTAAAAKDCSILVDKQRDLDVRKIEVRGGTVSGLPSGREGEHFEISVSLPDEICLARVLVHLRDMPFAEMWFDFCTASRLSIGRADLSVIPPLDCR